MVEFQEIVREFHRLCETQRRLHKNTCDKCPIKIATFGTIFQCYRYVLERPEEAENIIMSWAAEHQEPKYPTWLEWLHDLGLIVQREGTFTEYGHNEAFSAIKKVDILTIKGYQSIPADIAQKLGLEPKEV